MFWIIDDLWCLMIQYWIWFICCCFCSWNDQKYVDKCFVFWYDVFFLDVFFLDDVNLIDQIIDSKLKIHRFDLLFFRSMLLLFTLKKIHQLATLIRLNLLFFVKIWRWSKNHHDELTMNLRSISNIVNQIEIAFKSLFNSRVLTAFWYFWANFWQTIW